jgi:adenylate kinase family enzyme
VADRVLIYGVTGSGKSTMARRVAELTGLPWHAVDDLTWEPGWVAVPPDEQRRRIERICAGEQWVLDSAYGSWRDVVLSRADLIVALDYQRWRSLGRLARRTVARALDRRLICNGNTESFRQVFSRDSIIAWHFRSFDQARSLMRAWAADPAGPPVILMPSPAAARRWLAGLGPSAVD